MRRLGAPINHSNSVCSAAAPEPQRRAFVTNLTYPPLAFRQAVNTLLTFDLGRKWASFVFF